MSKRTHKKELERARAKRSAARGKQRRTRIIALVVIAAMALSVFAVAFAARDGSTPSPEVADDPAGDGGDQLFGTEGETEPGSDPDNDSGTAPEGEDAAGEASYDSPQAAEAEPCPTDGEAPEPSLDPYDAAPEMTIDPEATYTATIETTCGTIELALDASAAPATVNNFVVLSRDGYYDGVPFHRVMNGFMVQGGDPTGTGTGCVDPSCDTRLPGYQFEDELQLAEELVAEHGGYPRGTLAMANAGPDTNGSQFFIVQGEPGYPLPPQYAVFGRVTEGMDVVDRIAQGPAEGDLAVDPVRITSVTIEES